MSTLGIALVVGLALPFGVGVALHAERYRCAAAARRVRRDACPFEDDDDATRPFVLEAREVVAETLSHAYLLLLGALGVGRSWTGLPAAGRAMRLIVVLVPDRRLPAASLAPLAHRIARDPMTAVCIAPMPGALSNLDVRAARLADFLAALRARCGGSPTVLVAHGDGGLVARHALQRARGAAAWRLVTLGSPHAGARVPGVDVVAIYSLHDARLPPAHAYDPDAFNVALRDVGHLRLVLSARTYGLVLENIATGLDAGARAGAGAS